MSFLSMVCLTVAPARVFIVPDSEVDEVQGQFCNVAVQCSCSSHSSDANMITSEAYGVGCPKRKKTPCRRATPEMAERPFCGWFARRA
jgi:hypothetical protein